MATALLSHTYNNNNSPSYYASQQPQGPPSPPMDDSTRCSLPSISNLLDLADQGSPTSETSPQSQCPPNDFSFNSVAAAPSSRPAQPSRPSTRPSSSHMSMPSMRSGVLPPTPPMTTEASFGGHDSPSAKSVSQLPPAAMAPGVNYYFEATPPPQSDASAHSHSHSYSHHRSSSSFSHRHASHTPTAAPRHLPQRSLPMVQTASSSSSSSYASNNTQAPAPAPTAAAYSPPSYLGQPATAYYPSMPAAPAQPQVSGLYYQRPLPQTFPPMSVVQPSPWQHHHYISPAAAATFPQSQDRYICQTCSKAFSRPSSLRIHSHSHTGEKPFKCPHAGCGKAFSVRSNMKRHERGCHNYDSGN